jgi:23S rRNA U2552 (ribose-2'-O)-methylase RlmE/FtsJ
MTTFQLHFPVNNHHVNIPRNVAASGLKKAKSAPVMTTMMSSREYEFEIADEWQICKYVNKLKNPALQIDVPRRELLEPKMSELESMQSFHLAEGPGGFIEAVCNKRSNVNDRYYGMTILIDETDDNVPGWNKTSSFLEKRPNIQIEVGADGTGNILHIENFDYCVSKYASSMDLITADGGFDFSKDFNKQEISIMHLLWAQVCYAVCLQKCGGNFVLKIFDIFHSHTIDILYILAGFYSEVNVCKLQTSRIGNSEKYVVCKGFRFENNLEFLSIIRESFVQIKDVGLEKWRPLLHSLIPYSAPSSRQSGNTPIPYLTPSSRQSGNTPKESVGRSQFAERIKELRSPEDVVNPQRESMKDTHAKGDSYENTKNTQMPFAPPGLSIPDSFGRQFENTQQFEPIPSLTLSSRQSGNTQIHSRVWRLLNVPVPRHFTKQIEDVNALFGQQQIENIHYTLSLIDKHVKCDKTDQLTKQNITKCINWCIEHKVPYYTNASSNVFVSSTVERSQLLT